MIKLEDCTKEELIYLLRNKALIKADEAEFYILMYRADKVRKQAARESELEIKALSEYTTILRPYSVKPIGIPDSVLKKADHAFKRYRKHVALAERYDKLYDKIQKLINNNLDERKTQNE